MATQRSQRSRRYTSTCPGPRIASLAILALALGILVYVLDRPTVYFLPGAWGLAGDLLWFGRLGGYLPDGLHVYALILLTAAVAPTPTRILPICALWFAIDSLFELAQHPTLAPHVVAIQPAWFAQLPILENSTNYFLHGTFDPGDLIAIVIGTAAAYMTLRLILDRAADPASTQTHPQEIRHARQD